MQWTPPQSPSFAWDDWDGAPTELGIDPADFMEDALVQLDYIMAREEPYGPDPESEIQGLPR